MKLLHLLYRSPTMVLLVKLYLGSLSGTLQGMGGQKLFAPFERKKKKKKKKKGTKKLDLP